ncbi:DUF551 domain-containing protein [Escherichia coli]|nr:DUF551 domain-containing protein [Escherichia coli]
MTTFTDKKLIKEIKERISSLDVRDNIERRAYEIALTALTAEPFGIIDTSGIALINHGSDAYIWPVNSMEPGDVPLYIGLPRIAPASIPEAMTEEKAYSNVQTSWQDAKYYATGWNACRAAMLQARNFRENKNSSTNNFREIAETSTNYPVIPSEVLFAIQKVAKIRADFDDFDGDRRGIGDYLDEAEQELIVTINKYASQLAAEPIAPNDVREQTAIPQVPVTPDGWISCSERMPEETGDIIVVSDGIVMSGISYSRRDGFYIAALEYDDDEPIDGVTHWMPLPEPPQEAK